MQCFKKSEFYKIEKEGKLPSYKYKQTTPYLLVILINYEKGELAIEFTSKILGIKCVELVNTDNIYECLCNLSPLVEFEEDVDYILDEFKVVKCDVTKDVYYADDIKKKLMP
jgi:hypothetical protein